MFQATKLFVADCNYGLILLHPHLRSPICLWNYLLDGNSASYAIRLHFILLLPTLKNSPGHRFEHFYCMFFIVLLCFGNTEGNTEPIFYALWNETILFALFLYFIHCLLRTQIYDPSDPFRILVQATHCALL